jgi:predicted RNA-binding protein YlqC (UPF0109 family)
VSAPSELNPEVFLKDVLISMLDHPEAFRVEVKGEGRKRDVFIHADQKDRGRIIGKSGRMISSLRTLLKTAGEKSGLIINLELFEEDSKPNSRAEREGVA